VKFFGLMIINFNTILKTELNNLSIRQLRKRIKSNEYEILPEFTKNKLIEQKNLILLIS